jgi:hypothetical protein
LTDSYKTLTRPLSGGAINVKRNGIATVKIQVYVDAVTDRVLQQMIGLPGKTKGEVASWILREWIWHNPDALNRIGVSLKENTQKAAETEKN